MTRHNAVSAFAHSAAIPKEKARSETLKLCQRQCPAQCASCHLTTRQDLGSLGDRDLDNART